MALSFLVLIVVGSGIASATQLCGNTDCEKVYESGQAVEGSLVESTSSTFTLGGLGNISCLASTLKAKTTAKTGEPLPGEVTGLTFEKCNLGETSCTVKALNLPYKAAIKETGEGDGTLTVLSGGSGSPGVEGACGAFKCTATATEVTFNVEGGAAAARIKEAKLKKTSGAFCPETMSWTAEYIVTTPTPMQVGAAPTILCKVAPDAKGVCTKGEEYTGVVNGTLAAGVVDFDAGGAGAITCGKMSFQGTYPKAGRGPVDSLTFEGSSEKACSSTLSGSPKVTITAKGLSPSSEFEYRPQKSTQGVFGFGNFLNLEFLIDKLVCNYVLGGQLAYGKVANAGASATSVTVTAMRITTGDKGCPSQLSASFTMALTRGKDNVYLASTLAK